MKRYWPVWVCLTMAAINLPWVFWAKPLNIASAAFCLFCAVGCYLMTRGVSR